MDILEFFGYWIILCIIFFLCSIIASLVWSIIDMIKILKRDDTEDED